ncbi:hypothetical protein TH53_11425 [Pedobacter lusitanus]|uniref:Contig47, whole genome shotgun sequence n=1 Tax=Pedobacter lusitanus TaxID=1503925 RepID=A0A0D0FX25_9SPHI|nr:hypothetical protein TH53_11425 [Pedobacter lusitanus]
MAQPAGILAKIRISEENYRKYVKKRVAGPLADIIFENLTGGSRNYYVFKYLKKENCIYVFFLFSLWQFRLSEKLQRVAAVKRD